MLVDVAILRDPCLSDRKEETSDDLLVLYFVVNKVRFSTELDNIKEIFCNQHV